MATSPYESLSFTCAAAVAETLLPIGLDVREQLNSLFEIRVRLLSENAGLEANGFLGQNATVRIATDNGERCFNGFITCFEQQAPRGRYSAYTVVLAPWLWFLTCRADCRIFSNLRAPEVAMAVCRDAGFSDIEDRLDTVRYAVREYCVQYRESDFNFVSRLLEQEGICAFFRHEAERHILVLCDDPNKHAAGSGPIPFKAQDQALVGSHLHTWRAVGAWTTAQCALADFNYEKPDVPLLARHRPGDSYDQAGAEWFDFPGAFKEQAQGAHLAQVAAEALLAGQDTIQCEGDVRELRPGHTFELKGHPQADANRAYLVTGIELTAALPSYESGAINQPADAAWQFNCKADLIDAKRAWRPLRHAAPARVSGPQTAVVSGASDVVDTDELGRVRVIFHWDRDQQVSCYVRVAQPWAGAGWGGQFIPHAGQEVMIDFLEGDPDRPVITGALVNADRMPACALPGEKRQCRISDECGNSFSMSSEPGQEHIQLQDTYGNAIKMDAVEGTIRLYSPSHDSELLLGKSFWWKTKSSESKILNGSYSSYVRGFNNSSVLGFSYSHVLGASIGVTIIYKVDVICPINFKTVGGLDMKVVGGPELAIITGAKVDLFKGWKFKAGAKFWQLTLDKSMKGTTAVHQMLESHQELYNTITTACAGDLGVTAPQQLQLINDYESLFTKANLLATSVTETAQKKNRLLSSLKGDRVKVTMTNVEVKVTAGVQTCTGIIKFN